MCFNYNLVYVVKHSPVTVFLVEMLLFCFVTFIVHASICCPRFSQKQSANQPKQIQGNVLLLNCACLMCVQSLHGVQE